MPRERPSLGVLGMNTELFKWRPVPSKQSPSWESLNSREIISAQTIRVALVVASLTSLGFVMFYALFSQTLAFVHAGAGFAYTLAFFYFKETQNFISTTRACCGITVAVVAIVNWFSGGIASPAIAFFILPAVASALIVGWKDGWMWISVGSACACFYFGYDLYATIPESIIPQRFGDLAALLYCLTLAIVIGLLCGFWVTRQTILEKQLSASLAQSEADAFMATFLAQSAIAANGSLGFDQAASVCLALLCRAQQWHAGHIWRVDDDDQLISSGQFFMEPDSGAARLLNTVAGQTPSVAEISASVALATAAAIVDLGNDPRFADEQQGAACSILAWPIEIEGSVRLVLEFFSDTPIELDDNVSTLLAHVGVQLTHVNIREVDREKTEKLAFTDLITGLPNRAGFEHLFHQKLKDAKRTRSILALMFIDLDGFKRVNDSLGHDIGDRLLQVVGRRLTQNLRSSDVTAKIDRTGDVVAARLGGDEFVLLLSDLDDCKDSAIVAERFLNILSEPIDVGVQEVNIGASIGIASYPNEANNQSDLMRLADAAMYEAKGAPGNQYRFATAALNEAIQRRQWVESELHRAIRRNELEILYLPIASSNSGRVTANEIAVRWPHREGDIAFDEFFSIAEGSNLICELGYWVLDNACATIGERRKNSANQVISVDVAASQLQQPNFVEQVAELFRRYGCQKGLLELEFSDTTAVLKNAQCRDNLYRLHELGVHIVLDRFGTGYSSLTDLCELPVWRIKLDRKFVQTVHAADGNRSMGRAIIAMAHSMGIETTIFNVSTAAEAQWFRELGCDAIQGSYVGGPSPTPQSDMTTRRPSAPSLSIAIDNTQ
ncbi:MAG: diguanylate cyclase (GGDEF)-like protein [Gammaproteobacteria bacterium]